MGILDGRVALITGGSSGIGLAAAKRFLQEGARVAIVGRNPEKLEKAAGELGNPDRLMSIAADVSKADEVAEVVAKVTERWGKIDILVNNAGTNLKERLLRQLTIDGWDRLIRTNLDGAFYCIHAVLPQMRERRDGVVINVVSIAGKRASQLGGAAYSASKFGMASLGLSLGAEEKDNGIRVCNIYPGEVDTPILEHRPQQVTPEHRRRILKPEDVAEAIVYVASQPPHVSIPELVIKPTTQLYV